MLSPLIFAALLSIPHEPDGIRFVDLSGIRPYSITLGATVSPEFHEFRVDPGFEWNEAVVSWNLGYSSGGRIRVDAKVPRPDIEAPMYNLGEWSLDAKGKRQSKKDQSDLWASVDTDTLILKKPARELVLTLALFIEDFANRPKVKLLGVCFRNTAVIASGETPNRRAWGKTIEVPRLSQMSYEGGNVWCSPTCVSMLLGHWAIELKRPDLNKDVPEVAANVDDPNWPGTGNWPFNTAYAGSFPGMRAYVARFGSVREIEDWIAAGIPVATSVSSALLKGKPKKEPNDGHLVVVVGFTKDGDPVFNDPGRSVEIRQNYKREHFEAAWKSSGNTVYLIYPESRKPPANRLRHWAD